MARRPYHKRWHGDAINGYAPLTLEERGAYTTLLDQMYDRGGPLRDEVHPRCGDLNCDVRVWKRLRASLVDRHQKLRPYSDEKGVSWLVNDRVQAELGLPTYAELVANLQPKLPIAIADLSASSAENRNENSESCEIIEAENGALLPLPLPHNPPTPEGGEGDGADEPVEADPVRAAFDDWNETAKACALPVAKDLTSRRRRNIGRRLSEHGPEGWAAALRAVAISKFCRGQKTDFKADLDFVSQAKSFQKLLEGSYGQDAKAPLPATGPINEADVWRSRINGLLKARHWKDAEWGPRPGQPGCRAPADIIAGHQFGTSPGVAA